MPDLLLELFSEEIPARMQARAAEDLARLVAEALSALSPAGVRTFYGPRRIALAADLAAEIPAASSAERGPRLAAPDQAVAGFLRKHGAGRKSLTQEDGYWVLHKAAPAQSAAALVAAALPGLLRRFPWPKSMRWGGSGSAFTWVRPLRRILCILDGAPVPFDLRDGPDDGHGLASGALTEGHRFFDPAPFAVTSLAQWRAGLLARRVVVDAAERRRVIVGELDRLAAAQGATVVGDPALLDEVAGLVEWPVPLLGRIDAGFMDLPAEVMQVSMRVNQRYFALRAADGAPAALFGFAANIEAADGGRAIVAGNERVLRARFSDARHFWDGDRRVRLADRVAALDAVTFHAKLGTQGARVHRIMQLAEHIAPLVGADPSLAARAAWLAKADLTAGMVGEFPELQGVMGRYYALHDGEDPAVANAVRDHYAPRGPSDAVPHAPVSVAVALADKLDLLVAFFGIGETPTGSGDPYALRRAALGVIRIIRINAIQRLHLTPLIALSAKLLPNAPSAEEVLKFILDRFRILLRQEGLRHDILDAILAVDMNDDIDLLNVRTMLLSSYIGNPISGGILVGLCKRASNIVRIENAKDGPHDGSVDEDLFYHDEERYLYDAVDETNRQLDEAISDDLSDILFSILGQLQTPLDNFFKAVSVNNPQEALRRNRLRLLNQVRATMDRVADFSRIEG